MRVHRITMLGLVLVGWTGAARAALQLVPTGQPACVFGGVPGSISVTFSNTSDQDFGAEMRSRIYQASSATAMPVSDTAWKTLRVLPQQTVLESAELDFPAVKAETKFFVQWMENSNHIIGTTEVWVYPTNVLAELKPMLGGGILGVLDPNNALKPLLKQNEIELTDLGASSLENFSGKLAILGPFQSKDQWPENMAQRCKIMAAKGTAVVWLQPPSGPRDRLRPSYCAVSAGTNAIIIVQSEVVANLEESPEAQARLVQLCRQALHPEPGVLPEINNQP